MTHSPQETPSLSKSPHKKAVSSRSSASHSVKEGTTPAVIIHENEFDPLLFAKEVLTVLDGLANEDGEEQWSRLDSSDEEHGGRRTTHTRTQTQTNNLKEKDPSKTQNTVEDTSDMLDEETIAARSSLVDQLDFDGGEEEDTKKEENRTNENDENNDSEDNDDSKDNKNIRDNKNSKDNKNNKDIPKITKAKSTPIITTTTTTTTTDTKTTNKSLTSTNKANAETTLYSSLVLQYPSEDRSTVKASPLLADPRAQQLQKERGVHTHLLQSNGLDLSFLDRRKGTVDVTICIYFLYFFKCSNCTQCFSRKTLDLDKH
ncbi:hypothetical protein RFI_14070 [Reticulomyxa filosa]|uniref:Uncharacterized protein n=1 Tax=Reticulomyxa filosa TaxID=46433 RepID=X6NCR7_RETFI|nr:hypothetical protein RFI_14070 [Reticulomyxa filosa]|eukprot:ETO23117.1 hypothetical protein RFI_14070 [Reticulomyxa filosa]